jgi:hypothetical protein
MLTELDQEHPITFLLIRGENHNAREIIVIIGYLLLPTSWNEI